MPERLIISKNQLVQKMNIILEAENGFPIIPELTQQELAFAHMHSIVSYTNPRQLADQQIIVQTTITEGTYLSAEPDTNVNRFRSSYNSRNDFGTRNATHLVSI